MPLVAWGDEWLKELVRARAHTIDLQASNIDIYLMNHYAHALLGFAARLIRRSERGFLRGFLLYIALPSYSLLTLIPLANMQLGYKAMSMIEHQKGIGTLVKPDSRNVYLWNMWLTEMSWLDVLTGLWENHLRLVSTPWSYEYTAMFKLLPVLLL